MNPVRDNKSLRRFELDVDGGVAFANYRLAPGTIILTHTETPSEPCAAVASPRNWSRGRWR